MVSPIIIFVALAIAIYLAIRLVMKGTKEFEERTNKKKDRSELSKFKKMKTY